MVSGADDDKRRGLFTRHNYYKLLRGLARACISLASIAFAWWHVINETGEEMSKYATAVSVCWVEVINKRLGIQIEL